MKKIISIFCLFSIVACSSNLVKDNSNNLNNPTVSFYINVTDPSDDLFHVTVFTSNLNENNEVYNFASTAPGTYSVLDFGRLVKTFNAYDAHGNELKVENISTNQWKIIHPEKLARLEYDIEDSFDAGITDYPISPMCGSGIEYNFIALNTFAVLGYFEGLQSEQVELKIDYNSDWEIGTSLPKKSNGLFYAETFDHLADSPILIGDLTVAETYVNDILVQVFVTSPDTAVNAEIILSLAENVLQSASGFIGYSPVSEYKFLMCLLDEETFIRNNLYGGGALEHSYSSLYVMPSSPNKLNGLKNTMAHEFLHILTPLLLHSEIIHTFNFEEPTPSQHIWMYEGVTEWASDIMQLRAGVIDIDSYMKIISQKLRMNDHFDQSESLKEMALTSYDISGYGAFLNFYEKGAITVALLDLKILELSDGTKGFRDVFLTLLESYGKDKPFSEKELFEVIVEETYPEIDDFIKDYITGAKPLPYIEYFRKLGYEYIPERVSQNARPSFGTNIGMNGEMEIVTIGVHDEAKKWGMEDGDVILELLGYAVTMESIRDIVGKASEMKIGDPFVMKVKRDDEIIKINGIFQQIKEKHIFIESEKVTEQQLKFREAWSKNI